MPCNREAQGIGGGEGGNPTESQHNETGGVLSFTRCTYGNTVPDEIKIDLVMPSAWERAKKALDGGGLNDGLER